MYGVLDVSTSALVAQRTQLDVIAGNIAMKDAYTQDADGNSIPYRRRVALFAPGDPSHGKSNGVHVDSIADDPIPFGLRWDPDDPRAVKSGDDAGYVRISNVDYHTEMVNAMVAARAYEANITVMEIAKTMTAATLQLLG